MVQICCDIVGHVEVNRAGHTDDQVPVVEIRPAVAEPRAERLDLFGASDLESLDRCLLRSNKFIVRGEGRLALKQRAEEGEVATRQGDLRVVGRLALKVFRLDGNEAVQDGCEGGGDVLRVLTLAVFLFLLIVRFLLSDRVGLGVVPLVAAGADW